MSTPERVLAAARAREWGYGPVLAFTAELLTDRIGVDPALVEPFGPLSAVRRVVARATLVVPAHPVGRSATRFAYPASLCQTASAAASYAVWASRGRAWAWRHTTER
jgi:hypothetical protein